MIDWNCLHDSSCRSWQRPIDAPMNYCGTIIHRQSNRVRSVGTLPRGLSRVSLAGGACRTTVVTANNIRQAGSWGIFRSHSVAKSSLPTVRMTVPMLKNDRPGTLHNPQQLRLTVSATPADTETVRRRFNQCPRQPDQNGTSCPSSMSEPDAPPSPGEPPASRLRQSPPPWFPPCQLPPPESRFQSPLELPPPP